MTGTIQKHSNVTTRISWHHFLPLAIVALISATILFLLHDTYWWPQDDGVFAYLADQLKHGKIYGVDVHDIHPGYHSFLNAFMLKAFGQSFVSLRYPVIAITIAQSLMVAFMLREKGFWVSIAGGVMATAFGFIQFLSPSPNWYALFFAISSVFIFKELPSSSLRNMLLGVIVGVCFMFRHPSGIFLGFGVLFSLLHEISQDREKGEPVGFLFAASMGLILCGCIAYSYLLFEPFAFLSFGIWPIVLTIFVMATKRAQNITVLKAAIPCALGFALSILPMIIYQLTWGDIGIWFMDSFLSGNQIIDKDFFTQQRYINLPIKMAQYLTGDLNPIILARFIYWVSILIIPIMTGVLACKAALKKDNAFNAIVPIVSIAAFFGYTSYYYQIPFYYYCSLPLYILALLFLLKPQKHWQKFTIIALLVFLNMAAFFLEAPFMNKYTLQNTVKSQIPYVDLHIKKEQEKTYTEILDLINQHTMQNDYIYSFPLNPELYFLSERQNPFTTYGSTFHIKSEADLKHHVDIIMKNKPPLLIFNKESKYVTPNDLALVQTLTDDGLYAPLTTIDGFVIYKATSF